MKIPATHHERVANMTFATVYPLYLKKITRKGRTQEELDQVIMWLTGYGKDKLELLIAENVSFKVFFDRATLNPRASMITGTICGYKIELIDNPTTRSMRYLDKLVDELAKGKPINKILR